MKYIISLILVFSFSLGLYSITPNEEKLIYAVQNYDIENIKKYIEEGVSPSVKDKDGKTALHYSVQNWGADIVEILLASKYANINVRDNMGLTPLHYSFRTDTSEIALILIDRGANINLLGIENETYLHYAALSGFDDVAEILIDRTKMFNPKVKYVNSVTKGGKTPLHYAVFGGSIDTVKLLVENGANIEKQNLDGQTPMDVAVMYGLDNIIYYLNITKEIGR